MTEPRTSDAPRRALWAALALLVFGLALAQSHAGFFGADWSAEVPLPAPSDQDRGERRRGFSAVTLNDYRMGVWAFSRNAHALLHRPHRIYQAEPCHPTSNALALHHPVITQGLLALPGYLATGDPVAATNVLLLLTILLGASATALLVADWTAVPAAGLVAGLLYAFHPAQIGSPFHLGTQDYTWTLLALFFAQRLFARRRWRDAVGLAACGVLQMATSFYPLLAAATIALPVAVWLVWHVGPKRVPVTRLALVAAIVAAAALFLFSPYLELRAAGVLERSTRFFAAWSRFAPGGWLFPGWTCLLLAGAAFALGRERALGGIRGDPRWALAGAAFLLLWLATGGNVEARMDAVKTGAESPAALPNLFAWVRAVLPGLESVRLPSMLASGARMLLCVLAGLGAAALLRRVPRRALPFAAALLVLLAAVETLRPPFLGLQPRVAFEAFAIRPDEDAIALFAELEAAGNRGPLFEVPIDRKSKRYAFVQAPQQHLLTAWHHRRTSGCSPAYTPPQVRPLAALATRLARPGALEEVRELGFTTIVVHHSEKRSRGSYVAVLRRIARRSDRLELLAENEKMTVYALGEL